MSIEAGQVIYRTVTGSDASGLFDWWTIERRSVASVTDRTVVADSLATVRFPEHTPLDPLDWESTPGGSVVLSIGDVGEGRLWDTSMPTLPDPEDLPETIEQDYLDYKAEDFSARELGRTRPNLTDESRRLVLIHEYRQGLLAL